MQAQFICMTLNLVTLMALPLEKQEAIINAPEVERRAKRTEAALLVESQAKRPPAPAW
jgi:hypothetical protein